MTRTPKFNGLFDRKGSKANPVKEKARKENKADKGTDSHPTWFRRLCALGSKSQDSVSDQQHYSKTCQLPQTRANLSMSDEHRFWYNYLQRLGPITSNDALSDEEIFWSRVYKN